jgi:hypothetical protein
MQFFIAEYPVTSSFLLLNILLRTLFSNILKLMFVFYSERSRFKPIENYSYEE